MSDTQNENTDETPVRLSSINASDLVLNTSRLRNLYNSTPPDFAVERNFVSTACQNAFTVDPSLFRVLKNIVSYINFSEALKLLKEGKKISNNSWEPESYLFLCDTVSIDTLPSTELINKKQFIWFSSETNQYDLWKSNSEDLLSEQWFEYTDN